MYDVAIRVMTMPRDTNPNGTIFGGVILSYLDQAGAVAAERQIMFDNTKHMSLSEIDTPVVAKIDIVTVAMDSVEFKKPVFVGDVLSFYTSILSVGNTSIKVRINVEAERAVTKKTSFVTTADIVYVAVDSNNKPVQIRNKNKQED